MKLSTDGLILKEMSISDNDKLITILTRKEGIIRAFVKGAKNLKNKNAAATQLLCYSRFTIYKGRDKYIIDESQLEELFFELRGDIEKLSIAQYFCELCISVIPEETYSEDFLRLILNALFFLCKDKLDKELVKSVVEMRLMSLSGYAPNLVCCKNCAKYEDKYMYFVTETGDLYCSSCFKENTYKGLRIDMGVLTALRHSIYSEFKNIFSFNLPCESKKILSVVTEAYVCSRLEKTFRSLDFYTQIKAD